MIKTLSYLAGFCVGTSLAWEAPPGFVHNWWLYVVGLVLLAVAIFWPERKTARLEARIDID